MALTPKEANLFGFLVFISIMLLVFGEAFVLGGSGIKKIIKSVKMPLKLRLKWFPTDVLYFLFKI